MTLDDLAALLKQHEAYSYAGMSTDEPDYTRHTLEHIAKLMGKLGNVVEPREHGLDPSTEIIRTQVIPDLLYYALGLAAKHQVDLEQAFVDRLRQNRAKISDRQKGILEAPSC